MIAGKMRFGPLIHSVTWPFLIGPNLQYVHVLRAGLCHAPARHKKCPPGDAARAPSEASRRAGAKSASPFSKSSSEAAP